MFSHVTADYHSADNSIIHSSTGDSAVPCNTRGGAKAAVVSTTSGRATTMLSRLLQETPFTGTLVDAPTGIHAKRPAHYLAMLPAVYSTTENVTYTIMTKNGGALVMCRRTLT